MFEQGKRVAIACQGGGSQCAFVAGALETLLASRAEHGFEVVGLSGTSGGALTAAVAWAGLLKEARGDRTPPGDRILACWRDLMAQTPLEMMLDATSVQVLRMTEQGLLPSFESSPSSPQSRFWSQALASMIARPAFTDLRALVVKHVDFAALPSLVEAQSPVLLVGAGDVLDGTFKIFSSARGEIKPEAVLASAAIPTLFPAVWTDGHAYWDGIFASNPPVVPFLRKVFMGEHARPDEIWIIQVNRSRRDSVPERPSDVFDRRNQLAGNLSLQHELELIELVNRLVKSGAFTPEFRASLHLDAAGVVKVRFIRMSEEMAQKLDYPSKLSRQPAHINGLIAEGEARASAFLATLGQSAEPEEAESRLDPALGVARSQDSPLH
jgi:NTE family protein